MSYLSVDYVVIGAGPAGLQIGYFLEQAGRDYLILEAGESPGTFFRTYPRHRKLISINKRFTGYDDPEINLRWDWNSLLSDDSQMRFGEYSDRYFPAAKRLVDYLGDFARRFELNVRYHTRVVNIEGEQGFDVTDSEGNHYQCRRLIVATGLFTPYLPDIPGIELSEHYAEVAIDPNNFVNQRVLIIGKGNSAFETADNILGSAAVVHLVSPNPVKMAWQTHYVGNLRAVNNNFLDTYQLKSQNAVLDAEVHWIKRGERGLHVSVGYLHANGECEELVYDSVITCTGFQFDTSIFAAETRPELVLNNRLPDITSEWESVNIPNLYFCGTLMQMRDHKKTTSAFIHGFRYNARALFRILSCKYHKEGWPRRRLKAVPEVLTDVVLERVNRTSALWQQFGFLCDAFMFDMATGCVWHYEELSVDYVRERKLEASKYFYLLTLEYGEDHVAQDPFNNDRIERHDVSRAAQSQFLHPVMRRYNSRGIVSEHHVIEDLAAEWIESEHREPLLDFLRGDMVDATST